MTTSSELYKAITIRDLTFKWKSQQENLLEIDRLEVRKGERLFLKGASGSGKSSFLSLLAGINIPQTGNVELLGQSINQLSASKRDEFRGDHIGYIFQMFNLVPYLSVIENVMLPCHFSKYRRMRAQGTGGHLQLEAKRLLDQIGLSGKEVIDKPVTELSVGQQQRVAACRALIGKPEVVIADEPTSALDADAQQSFVNLLSQECREHKITLIFVSHDERLMKAFDRSIVLREGRISGFSQRDLREIA